MAEGKELTRDDLDELGKQCGARMHLLQETKNTCPSCGKPLEVLQGWANIAYGLVYLDHNDELISSGEAKRHDSIPDSDYVMKEEFVCAKCGHKVSNDAEEIKRVMKGELKWGRGEWIEC